MNREPCAIALTTALNEIQKAYPEIKHSFIFTHNKSIITGDQKTDEKTIQQILESLESLKQKTKTIGNLKSFSVNGKNGKLIIFDIQDNCLVLATSKNIDKSHIYSITHVIIPTILKTMEILTPPTTQVTPQKKLVVDTLSGFFSRDSVQIDAETLIEWTQNPNPHDQTNSTRTQETSQEPIDHVKIETINGNSTLCKVKEINDQKLKGKNIIRIPEKICNILEIKKGDTVKVKPMT
ncbi:MAG: hypothetical protein NWF06_06835 [Candidatus Bathyarchaeota archaeon]|nr:hypothetical protein [Candidatus Bathyarchaeum sp.]